MKNPSVSFRGVGVSRSLGLTSICYCGEKSVLRIVKTTKNKRKQFWGYSKYKVREVEGMLFLVFSVIGDNCLFNFCVEWK